MSVTNKVKPRVEYVNRSGDPVDPKTGRPLALTTRKNKEVVMYPHIPYPSFPGISQSSRSITREKKKNGSSKKGRNRPPLPVKLTGAIFGNLDPIPTDPRIDPPPHNCFNCWQKGHTRPKCPRPVVSSYCINCGRRGVDLPLCPRCGRIYLMNHAENPSLYNLERNDDEMFQEPMYNYEDRRREEELERNMRAESPLPYSSPLGRNRESSPYQSNYERSLYDRNNSQSHYDRNNSPPHYDRTNSPPLYDRTDRSPEYASEWSRNLRGRDDECFQDKRESSMFGENSCERLNEPNSLTNDYSKYTNMNTNPVQEMLELIKSISHLPASTQEMIVRQVMEERQYKLRLMMSQNEPKINWP